MPPHTTIYYRDAFAQYRMAFYNTVIMLTGNEMAPRTEAEFAFVSFSMISGAILYANIFGEMTVLV